MCSAPGGNNPKYATDYMAKPAELCLSEHCEDARHTCLLEDFSVWDFVRPLHSEQFAEAVEVKSVEFLGVPLVYYPALACI